MTRRVVTPKSNSISRGDLATKVGHGINALPTFRPIFRYRNESISEIPPTHVVTIYLNFIFPKYQLPTLGNKKVIRCQATGSVIRNFRFSDRKIRIFAGAPKSKFWLGYRFRAFPYILPALPGAARCALASTSGRDMVRSTLLRGGV